MEELTYFIDLRADSAGGNPVADVNSVVIRTETQPNPNPVQPLDPELIQAVQGRDVLLGTHGFHVNRACGIDYLSHWHEWLQLGDNGFFVGVLWPGDSSWLPFLDYPVEGNEAIKSGHTLAEYLRARFAGVNSLSFVSHSLGARIMLQTINDLGQTFKMNALTIMAGAIDDTCLVKEYQQAAKLMNRVSVLASSKDDVLEWAFPAGNLASGIVSRGDPYWHGALGRYGPYPASQPMNLWQTPNLPESWNFGHHSYINTEGNIGGPPPESGSFPLPQIVPPRGTEPLSDARNWQQAWAAGFVSTRFGK
ncbi:MAG TPA: alpha/beta hydrolase [Terriglobales bacterium]|nr:alpha/beta hydrolase [Terriglobales bacterium]